MKDDQGNNMPERETDSFCRSNRKIIKASLGFRGETNSEVIGSAIIEDRG